MLLQYCCNVTTMAVLYGMLQYLDKSISNAFHTAQTIVVTLQQYCGNIAMLLQYCCNVTTMAVLYEMLQYLNKFSNIAAI